MIILEPKERDYLTALIQKHPSNKPWEDKGILNALESDRVEKQKMAECEHLPGSYSGKKTCCSKCESFYQEGMGFSWELDNHE